jgi:hypothetical protein
MTSERGREMIKPTNFTFTITSNGKSDLARMSKELGHSTQAHTIRFALSLLMTVSDAIKEGYAPGFINQGGEVQRILVPELERLRKKRKG